MLIGPFQFPTEEQDLTITLTRYFVQPPTPSADNPFDYYGYEEIEYEAEDERGQRYVPTHEEDQAIIAEIKDRCAAEENEAAIAAAEAKAEFPGEW